MYWSVLIFCCSKLLHYYIYRNCSFSLLWFAFKDLNTYNLLLDKEEQSIIVYVVIGFVALLLLFVLIIAIVCYRNGKAKLTRKIIPKRYTCWWLYNFKYPQNFLIGFFAHICLYILHQLFDCFIIKSKAQFSFLSKHY